MTVALLETPPLVPPVGLGPYRRADCEALPDEPRCEWIFGRFHESPSPTPRHQYIAACLWRLLDDIARRHGGTALIAPVDVFIAEHSTVQPDVLYIQRGRLAITAKGVEGAPDLLIEVLSPRTGRRDRNDKMRLYAQSGVREYWIVDPGLRQIEFLALQGEHFVVQDVDGGKYRSAACPEVELDVEALWTAVEQRFAGEQTSP